MTASSEGGHVELFAELVGVEGMRSVVLREAMPGQDLWLRLNVDEPFTTMLPRVAPLLPDGLGIELYRPGTPGTVRFTTAPTLTEADVTSFRVEDVSVEELVRAWNSAG